MSKGHIKRAENNQHFVDLREDFPRVTVKEIAKKLGCSAASVYMWCSESKRYAKIPPIWTVDAVAEWRKELEAETAARRGVNPLPEPLPDQAPKSVNAGMFLVTVPAEKEQALKSVVAMFGGQIVEM